MIRVALAAAAIAVAAAACSMLQPASPVSPGQPEREALVSSFLVALASEDASAILGMVTPGVDAQKDVADALAAHGGVVLTGVDVSWRDEFGGAYVLATVTGTGDDGAVHTIEVPVTHVSGRYYLALGEAADPGSVSSPESPRPSS